MGNTMAVGKNKGLVKGGKKGLKKKIIDPFTRKDWYDVKAPSMFTNRQIGKTLVNRTQGTRIASEGLKGRVFEVSLADLQSEPDAERSFRKFRLISEAISKDIEKACQGIYPLHDANIRKVKVLKK